MDMAKRLQLKVLIDKVRQRAEEAGLTEEDVLAEIGIRDGVAGSDRSGRCARPPECEEPPGKS